MLGAQIGKANRFEIFALGSERAKGVTAAEL
jgi:hypothetical protein